MNMIEAANAVRSRVSGEHIAFYYGFHPNRAGFIRCPFHGEKTPSLKVYKTSGWHCFGCGAGGSAIDFVMKMEGLSFGDAVRKIDKEMDLGLFCEEKQENNTDHEIRVKMINGFAEAEERRIREAADEKEAEIMDRFPFWIAACSLPREYKTEITVQMESDLGREIEKLLLEKDAILKQREEVIKWKNMQLSALNAKKVS